MFRQYHSQLKHWWYITRLKRCTLFHLLTTTPCQGRKPVFHFFSPQFGKNMFFFFITFHCCWHFWFLWLTKWSPWFLLSGCDHFIISLFPGPKGRYTSLTNTMKKWVNKRGRYFTRYKCSWKYWKYFYRAPLGMWNRCPQLWRDRCVLILKQEI